MSSHFSANQYESAFSPQRLQNYQIPAKYKEHPSMRKGKTAIISNERGHLNAYVPQSTASPWGTFVGTWQMERKPLNIKTKTKLLATTEQTQLSPPGSRQSTRASSARPTSVRSNASRQSPTSKSEGNKSPQPDLLPGAEATSPISDVNSRPATVSSVRSSAQGSRLQSPASSIRSPTPKEDSRASSVARSISIASPPSTSEKRITSNHLLEAPPRPQSPPQPGMQSRLHTTGDSSPAMQSQTQDI